MTPEGAKRLHPLHILHAVPAYYPFKDKGGPVVKVRALARGLVQRGHKVTVLTVDLGLDKQPSVQAEPCGWGHRLELDGVEVIYLATLASYRAFTINPRVVQFCKNSLQRCDVVHFYGLYDLLGPAVSLFCRRGRIPYVIEPMGMYRPIDRSLRLKRVWHCTLGKTFWRNATRIVATSEIEKQDLVEGGVPPQRIVVRYNGIDGGLYSDPPPRGTFREKWRLSPEEPLVLFLSRLIPRKGADILIEAFAEVCAAGRLVVAGPEGMPGYLAYLKECARQAGVETRVLFAGPLYDEDKKAALADADIFVLPSRYENFANAAAEAIAYGVPAIVGEACGIRSLIEGHAGLIVAPTKQEVAGALRRLMEDRALYARLQHGCHQAAAQLDWDMLTEQMEGHYRLAVAQRPDVQASRKPNRGSH